MTAAARSPRWIGAILASPLTWWFARLLLVGAYLVGGIVKLGDWPGAVAEQAHFGMPAPAMFAALTIAVELIGPALILSRRWIWLGAGMLGMFTLLAATVANAFWLMPAGQARFAAANGFFEHLGLVGGFVLVAMVGVRRA